MEKFEVRGVEWGDFTSYSRGQERIPTTYRAKIGGINILIMSDHRYYPGKWCFTCYDLKLEAVLLSDKVTTREEAAAIAFDACHLKASNLCDAFKDCLAREAEAIAVAREREG